jgi:hypothetical protein
MGPNYFKSNCVCDVGATEEGQSVVTVMMKEQISESAQGEEKEEQTLEILIQWEQELNMLEDWLDNPKPEDGFKGTVMQIVGEENLVELLKNFNRGVEHETTAALDSAAEEEADNIEFVDLYEEPKSLERRVIVQSMHIQQDNLETS